MQISEIRLQTISLLTLTVIVCGIVLHLLQDVVMPFVLAAFFSLGLSPIVNFQKRKLHIPVVLAVTTTLCLALLLFWLGGLVAAASIEQLTQSAAIYENHLIQVIERLLTAHPLERLHLNTEQLLGSLPHIPIENFFLNMTNEVFHALSLFMLTFVLTAYLLVLLSRERKSIGVWSEIENRVRHYLIAKVIVSAAVGLIIGLALYFCGIKFALLFGLLTGLLNFIPYLGPIIASLLPWPIIFMSPDLSAAATALALFFPGTFFFFVGNFFEPKIFGQSVQLPPLVVLLVCMFWGVLWGPMGILLAVPITSALVLLSSQLEITQPIADLLTGQLQLPMESTTVVKLEPHKNETKQAEAKPFDRNKTVAADKTAVGKNTGAEQP
jgi:AI-2 transport protein TqsA